MAAVWAVELVLVELVVQPVFEAQVFSPVVVVLVEVKALVLAPVVSEQEKVFVPVLVLVMALILFYSDRDVRPLENQCLLDILCFYL